MFDSQHSNQHSNAQARGRPSKISKEQIVSAAMTLLEEQGLKSFSMAKLAAQMAIGAMSIYHYFPSKAVLLSAVAERVFGGFAFEEKEEADWESDISRWIKSVYTFLADNPLALDLIVLDNRTSEAWLRVSLPMLRILAAIGLSGEILAFASRWLLDIVMGMVVSERGLQAVDHKLYLPTTATLSVADRALVATVNQYYAAADKNALVALLADNTIEGLRRLYEGTRTAPDVNQ